MTFIDRHIVDAYSSLFEGLSPISKLELIERLSKSLKGDRKKRDNRFFKSFGAFASDKPTEQIIKEIKTARQFNKKDIKL